MVWPDGAEDKFGVRVDERSNSLAPSRGIGREDWLFLDPS